MIEDQDPLADTRAFQSIKIPVVKISRHDYNIPTIKYFAQQMHYMAQHTYGFLKLYYLSKYENQYPQNVIIINKVLIENICKTISCRDTRAGRPAPLIRNNFTEFYDNDYSHTIPVGEEKPSSSYLATPILYLTEQIMTNYENIVREGFYNCVTKYIANLVSTVALLEIEENVQLTQAQKATAIRGVHAIQLACVRDIFVTATHDNGDFLYNSLLLFPENQRVNQRNFLNQCKADIIPNREFENGNIMYDVKANPMQYFSKMVFMMRELEATMNKIDCIFPLITTNIPGHFRIDTCTLIQILYPTRHEEGHDYVMGRTQNTNKTSACSDGYMSEHKDSLWNLFFKTELHQLFHGSLVRDEGHEELDGNNQVVSYNENYSTTHKFTFNHTILTDGESATLCLVNKSQAHVLHPRNPPRAVFQEQYIHEINDATREELQDFQIAAVDPGMDDLLYAINADAEIHWRYTQNQRRYETDSNFYKNSLQEEKIEHNIEVVRNNVEVQRNIVELETEFGATNNKKVLTYEAFRSYLLYKNKLNFETRPFYQQQIHRKRRFQRYRKKQKSEARMLKSFKATFGGPLQVIVCIGDWSQNHHRRFLEPVKGKGFRKLFRKAGYRVFLVDEFRTSKRCSKCEDEEGICHNFRWVKNPKPRSRALYPYKICHGLLRCATCNTLWNRDVLGATNIHKISRRAIAGEDRPQYLQRDGNNN